MTNYNFIESRQNPIIKSALKLKDKKHRIKDGSYLVEGFRLIEEALKAKIKVNSIFYILEKEEEFKQYILPHLHEEKIFTTTPEIIAQLASTMAPQGIIATIDIPDVQEESLQDKPYIHSVFVYADGVQDPGNLGTLIRSCHASGVEGVIIGENTVDPYSEKVIRSSMGSIFHVPIYLNPDLLTKRLVELGVICSLKMICSLEMKVRVFQRSS